MIRSSKFKKVLKLLVDTACLICAGGVFQFSPIKVNISIYLLNINVTFIVYGQYMTAICKDLTHCYQII